MTKTPSSTRFRAPAVRALDPPGGVGRDLDPRLADDVAELPLGAGRGTPRRRTPAGAGSRARGGSRTGCRERIRETRKRADVVRSRSWPITYQRAVLGQERVRVDRPLALVVAGDRPVAELDRALLRDRRLELAEPALRARASSRGRAPRRARRSPVGARREHAGRAAEREVLQREPERLGVGELALEQVEAGLERRELVVVELERRQEVALGAERVELLAGELVALRVERHAERRRARRGRSRSAARTPRRSSPGSPRRST